MSITTTTCECGEVTGEYCGWTGQRRETVLIDWMPEWIRASHTAARNAGSWPANGALRLRVYRGCAESIAERDGQWTRAVGGAS